MKADKFLTHHKPGDFIGIGMGRGSGKMGTLVDVDEGGLYLKLPKETTTTFIPWIRVEYIWGEPDARKLYDKESTHIEGADGLTGFDTLDANDPGVPAPVRALAQAMRSVGLDGGIMRIRPDSMPGETKPEDVAEPTAEEKEALAASAWGKRAPTKH